MKYEVNIMFDWFDELTEEQIETLTSEGFNPHI